MLRSSIIYQALVFNMRTLNLIVVKARDSYGSSSYY